MTVKGFSYIAAAGALVWLAGCASAPTRIAVVQPVGPAPAGSTGASSDGQLQVYSAREKAPLDLNAQEYFWNTDFGRNDFLYEPAHSGYSLFTADGNLLNRVRNARGWSDGKPAMVTLAPGVYRIEAEVETDNGALVTAEVPVVVKPGQTTIVRLDRDWKPSAKQVERHELVQAYDGRFIGWRTQTEGIAQSQ